MATHVPTGGAYRKKRSFYSARVLIGTEMETIPSIGMVVRVVLCQLAVPKSNNRVNTVDIS